jgi:hypothetical protein
MLRDPAYGGEPREDGRASLCRDTLESLKRVFGRRAARLRAET